MNVLNITEQRLDPLFSEFGNIADFAIPLTDSSVINKYVDFFNAEKQQLLREYELAERAFSNLKNTDEIIKRGDQYYPPLLEATEQAPRFLYIRGKKSLLFEKRTVALVGSRQASEKAKDNTRRLAARLGENGITIVSGLAKGIDVTAHIEALRRGYNTIAVIGTNLNQYYPAENKEVQLMIEKKGLVVSQFSPANKTQRWFFPLRNGVMSGLSLATVIMEAGETSGALKQADFALRQGREVLIPRSALEIESISWPARYVSKGAKVVTSPKDVLEKLAESNIFKVDENYQQQTLDDYLCQSVEETKQSKGQWINQISDGE
jgi:DNA processing protein